MCCLHSWGQYSAAAQNNGKECGLCLSSDSGSATHHMCYDLGQVHLCLSFIFYLYNGDENPSLPHRVSMGIKGEHVWHVVGAQYILAVIRALIYHLICFSLGFLFSVLFSQTSCGLLEHIL